MSTARDDKRIRDSWRREDDSDRRTSKPELSKRHDRSPSPGQGYSKREKLRSDHIKQHRDPEDRSFIRRGSRERDRSRENRKRDSDRRATPRLPHQSKDKSKSDFSKEDELFDKKHRYRRDSPQPPSRRRRHSRSPSPEASRTKKSRRILSPSRTDLPNSLKPDLFEGRRRKQSTSPRRQRSRSREDTNRRIARRRDSFEEQRTLRRRSSASPPRQRAVPDSASSRAHRTDKESRRSPRGERRSRQLSPSDKSRPSRPKSPPSASEHRENKRVDSKDRSKYSSSGRHRETTSSKRTRRSRSRSPKRHPRSREGRRPRREILDSYEPPLRRRSRSRDSSRRSLSRRRRGRSRDRRSRSPRSPRDLDIKRRSEMSGMRNASPNQYYPSRGGHAPHKDGRMSHPSSRPMSNYGDGGEDVMMANADPRMRDPYPPQRDSRPPFQRPPYASSHSGQSMSPPPQSPYSNNGRSWAGSPPYHGQSMQSYPPSNYRQNTYPPPSAPQSPFYPNQSHPNGPYSNNRGPPYSAQPYDPGFQGGQYSPPHDRRFSGGPPSQFPSRGRGRGNGHFSGTQWNQGAAGRGRGQPQDPSLDQGQTRDRKQNDLSSGGAAASGPGQSPDSQDKSSKISFSLKSRMVPASGPRPDFATKMRESAGKSRQNGDGSSQKPTEPRVEKRMRKRLKPRPYLPAEFMESDSVYFRRPGNESVVGSGTYGKVFKAIHVYTNDLVALKKIRMEGERDGFPVTAVREIKLLQSLRHVNVVSLQEVMVEKNDCFMVFEYLSHDLTGLLNHPSFKLEDAHKKHLAKQLFDGLDYLHRRGVLHRDIKAANILVSNEGQLKLADFGLARFFAKRRQLDYTNRVITIWYRSPELLLGETQYGPAVDVWSAACVLIEIFTRHAIFPGDGGEINQLDKIYDILGTPNSRDWPGLVEMQWFQLLRPTKKKGNIFRERYKERLTPAAFNLLESMLQYDPAKRPTAGEVLQHAYFVEEEPLPKQARELRLLDGDWHEFESKALRKENERQAKEARRALQAAAASSKDQQQKEKEKEKEKRRASSSTGGDRESKRPRPSTTPNGNAAAPTAMDVAA